MKVILLKDVARIGRKTEIKDVPDGHALNFLIPRGFAKPATGENVKQVQAMKQKHSEHLAHERAQFESALAVLEGTTVTIAVEANEKGHLFKGLHETDIVDAINATPDVSIRKEYVQLVSPIKELGKHHIELLCGDMQGTVSLEVVNA